MPPSFAGHFRDDALPLTSPIGCANLTRSDHFLALGLSVRSPCYALHTWGEQVTRRFAKFFVGSLGVLALLLCTIIPSASASTVPPHTPPTSLQVWNVNIKQLQDAWDGFVDRMAVNPFAPDIILVQELSSADRSTFLSQVKSQFGTHYLDEGSTGNNVVIWNTERLTKIGYFYFSPADQRLWGW